MKIAIASDHGGYALKNELLPYITELGHEFRDFGCCSTDSMDYPDIAFPAAESSSAAPASVFLSAQTRFAAFAAHSAEMFFLRN